MAQKRMFSSRIVNTDDFLEMPLSSQALYFHFGMNSDDEGVVSSAKRIVRMIGAAGDDLKILLAKGFLIQINDKLILITHWYHHNTIQADRRKKSLYQKELSDITLSDKTYLQPPDTKCIQNVDIPDTQYSIVLDKKSIDIDKNLNQSDKSDNTKAVNEIIDYLNKTLNTKYRKTSQKTTGLIKARLGENFTVSDFEIVIQKMFTAWNNTEYQKFLRPETLFGNKFEGYLNTDHTVQKSNNFSPMSDYSSESLKAIKKDPKVKSFYK